MPRYHIENINEPSSVVEYPLLTAVGPYAFFTGSGREDAEAELTRLQEAIAHQYGGSGYVARPRAPREPEKGRER